jgi:hypothetical protein
MTSNREREEEVEEGKKDCIHMYKNKYCTEVNKNFLVLHILVSFLLTQHYSRGNSI